MNSIKILEFPGNMIEKQKHLEVIQSYYGGSKFSEEYEYLDADGKIFSKRYRL